MLEVCRSRALDKTNLSVTGFLAWSCISLLLRRFVFRMAEASAKRVTGDEPQGTMGKVQTAGEVSPVVPFPPSFARTFSSKERRLGTRQRFHVAEVALRAARSFFVHAPGILNFHGDTHKLDSSNYKALVLTHFLAHLRCAH